jgi:hypothetical protein
MRAIFFLFFALFFLPQSGCRPTQPNQVDEASQITMYDAALRTFRGAAGRRLYLSDTLLFDSLKPPKMIAPAIPRELARRGVIDSSCKSSNSGDCVRVRVSVPIVTGDSAKVFVSASNPRKHEYSSGTYQFVRDAGSWRRTP